MDPAQKTLQVSYSMVFAESYMFQINSGTFLPHDVFDLHCKLIIRGQLCSEGLGKNKQIFHLQRVSDSEHKFSVMMRVNALPRV